MRRLADHDADLPLVLLAIGFFLWMAFQTVQLVQQSQGLAAINGGQGTPLDNAARLRQATNSLASDTAQLAQSGDDGAKQVIAAMAQQNVVLRPAAAGAGGSPAPQK